MTYKYAIFRQGGNDTALVLGIQNDPGTRKIINDQILNNYSNVEQVGFISLPNQEPELMMAGGEFCGNATRSTAFYLLKGNPGEIQIKVSGVDKKLIAGVSKSKESFAQMPIYEDPAKLKLLNDGAIMVEMQGITHVVKRNDFPKNTNPEILKIYGKKYLQNLGLTESTPACGLMLVSQNNDQLYLDPIVWVKNMETLYYETACGSGTTALGLVEAKRRGKSVNMPVIQPSGMPINIKVLYDGRKFLDARISGPIKQLLPMQYMK